MVVAGLATVAVAVSGVVPVFGTVGVGANQTSGDATSQFSTVEVEIVPADPSVLPDESVALVARFRNPPSRRETFNGTVTVSAGSNGMAVRPVDRERMFTAPWFIQRQFPDVTWGRSVELSPGETELVPVRVDPTPEAGRYGVTASAFELSPVFEVDVEGSERTSLHVPCSVECQQARRIAYLHAHWLELVGLIVGLLGLLLGLPRIQARLRKSAIE